MKTTGVTFRYVIVGFVFMHISYSGDNTIINDPPPEHQTIPSIALQDGGVFSFAELFQRSNLVIEGVAGIRGHENNRDKVQFIIEKSHIGNAALGTIDIFEEDPINSIFLPEGERFLVFLSNNNGFWHTVLGNEGIISEQDIPDVVMIIEKFKTNSQLFDADNINDLQDLFLQIQNFNPRLFIWNDIKRNISANDLPFLKILFEMNVEFFTAESILQMGNLKIESMRLEIEQLLQSTNNHLYKFNSIIALGRIGNSDSYDVVKVFLFDGDQGLRAVAIQATGFLGNLDVLDIYIQIYPNEGSFTNRMAMIDAVLFLPPTSKKIDVLKSFQTTETSALVNRILDREIAALILLFTFVLDQNYPNPFNPNTTITYRIPENGAVTLIIFDLLGKEVVRLVDDNQNAGTHKVTWDASNIASGTYFYTLKAGDVSVTKRLLLIREK